MRKKLTKTTPNGVSFNLVRADLPLPVSVNNEIDFDDQINKLLLNMCRSRSDKSFISCENCKIKFKCWTFK
jgi:hypothetical protein